MSESINPCEICDSLGIPLNEFNCSNCLDPFMSNLSLPCQACEHMGTRNQENCAACHKNDYLFKDFYFMKKNVLVIEFHDAEGNQVRQLSKCPASPEDVMAALNFLTPGSDYVVSVQEVEFDNNNKVINNPLDV